MHWRASIDARDLETGSCIALRTGRGTTPGFLIAGIGHHTSSLTSLAKKLVAVYQVFGIQLPGVDEAELIAHQLRAQGAMVARLMVIDTLLPSAALGFRPVMSRLAVHCRRIKELSVRERVGYVSKFLRSRMLKPKLTSLQSSLAIPDANLADRLEQFEQACHQARLKYVPRSYDGAIDLIRASPRVWTQLHLVEPSLDWKSITANLNIHDVKGTHHELLNPSNLNSVATPVNNALMGASAGVQP